MAECKIVNLPDEDNPKYVVIVSFDDKNGKHHDIYEMIDLSKDDTLKAAQKYADDYAAKFDKSLK